MPRFAPDVSASSAGIPNQRSLGLIFVSTQPGYLAPAVSVASSLPRRGVKSAVLIVPVVSSGPEDVNDEPGAAVAAAEPFLPKDAVTEIEEGLRALNATGAVEQVHRLVVKSLPVASVLTVGLGKQRDEWPADVIRRAAGSARPAAPAPPAR